MNSNFQKCLDLVLQSEGGWVDGNKIGDPGGETNLGVTKKVWQEWVGHDVKTMKDLTPDDVAPMYKAKYWMACYAPQLKTGVDYCLFDAAVNMGPGRAVKLLQESIGCVPDGVIGPRTMQLIDQKNAQDVVQAYSNRKTSFYESLPTFATFGKGWLKRVEDVKSNALKMIGETP
jgi:lysozyme family protein